MNFKNRRLITCGVDLKVNPLLQVFMWHLIDELPEPKDYLQVFTCTSYDGKQKITHAQEEPSYKREYLIESDNPFFIGKIFVIDDDTHSTMLLAEEY